MSSSEIDGNEAVGGQDHDDEFLESHESDINKKLEKELQKMEDIRKKEKEEQEKLEFLKKQQEELLKKQQEELLKQQSEEQEMLKKEQEQQELQIADKDPEEKKEGDLQEESKLINEMGGEKSDEQKKDIQSKEDKEEQDKIEKENNQESPKIHQALSKQQTKEINHEQQKEESPKIHQALSKQQTKEISHEQQKEEAKESMTKMKVDQGDLSSPKNINLIKEISEQGEQEQKDQDKIQGQIIPHKKSIQDIGGSGIIRKSTLTNQAFHIHKSKDENSEENKHDILIDGNAREAELLLEKSELNKKRQSVAESSKQPTSRLSNPQISSSRSQNELTKKESQSKDIFDNQHLSQETPLAQHSTSRKSSLAYNELNSQQSHHSEKKKSFVSSASEMQSIKEKGKNEVQEAISRKSQALNVLSQQSKETLEGEDNTEMQASKRSFKKSEQSSSRKPSISQQFQESEREQLKQSEKEYENVRKKSTSSINSSNQVSKRSINSQFKSQSEENYDKIREEEQSLLITLQQEISKQVHNQTEIIQQKAYYIINIQQFYLRALREDLKEEKEVSSIQSLEIESLKKLVKNLQESVEKQNIPNKQSKKLKQSAIEEEAEDEDEEYHDDWNRKLQKIEKNDESSSLYLSNFQKKMWLETSEKAADKQLYGRSDEKRSIEKKTVGNIKQNKEKSKEKKKTLEDELEVIAKQNKSQFQKIYKENKLAMYQSLIDDLTKKKNQLKQRKEQKEMLEQQMKELLLYSTPPLSRKMLAKISMDPYLSKSVLFQKQFANTPTLSHDVNIFQSQQGRSVNDNFDRSPTLSSASHKQFTSSQEYHHLKEQIPFYTPGKQQLTVSSNYTLVPSSPQPKYLPFISQNNNYVPNSQQSKYHQQNLISKNNLSHNRTPSRGNDDTSEFPKLSSNFLAPINPYTCEYQQNLSNSKQKQASNSILPNLTLPKSNDFLAASNIQSAHSEQKGKTPISLQGYHSPYKGFNSRQGSQQEFDTIKEHQSRELHNSKSMNDNIFSQLSGSLIQKEDQKRKLQSLALISEQKDMNSKKSKVIPEQKFPMHSLMPQPLDIQQQLQFKQIQKQLPQQLKKQLNSQSSLGIIKTNSLQVSSLEQSAKDKPESDHNNSTSQTKIKENEPSHFQKQKRNDSIFIENQEQKQRGSHSKLSETQINKMSESSSSQLDKQPMHTSQIGRKSDHRHSQAPIQQPLLQQQKSSSMLESQINQPILTQNPSQILQTPQSNQQESKRSSIQLAPTPSNQQQQLHAQDSKIIRKPSDLIVSPQLHAYTNNDKQIPIQISKDTTQPIEQIVSQQILTPSHQKQSQSQIPKLNSEVTINSNSQTLIKQQSQHQQELPPPLALSQNQSKEIDQANLPSKVVRSSIIGVNDIKSPLNASHSSKSMIPAAASATPVQQHIVIAKQNTPKNVEDPRKLSTVKIDDDKPEKPIFKIQGEELVLAGKDESLKILNQFD